MGRYMDDDMSLTPQQEAMMADMFDDAERAEETAGYILSGESDLVDPDILVELFLDSPLERTNIAVMMARQLAKELADSHKSMYEQQQFIHQKTGKPVVIHIADDSDIPIKVSPAFEESLDLYTTRYIEFLTSVPQHIATESLGHYFRKINELDYRSVALAFYGLNPDVDVSRVDLSSIPRQSFERVIGELPDMGFKTSMLDQLSQIDFNAPVARTTLSGFAL